MAERPTLRRELIAAFVLVFTGAFLVASTGVLLLVPRLDSAAQSAFYVLIILVLDVGIFALFGHFMVTRRVLQPIDRLVAGAEAIARGDLAARAPESEAREINRLAQALNNMADALRYDFEKMNIRIQVINPGFVNTPLARKNTHLMPALMPDDKASRRMMKAIRSGGYETTFPWLLTWLLKFMRMWPHEPRFAFMNYVSRWRGYPLMPGRKRE